jgi:hypothetical protein
VTKKFTDTVQRIAETKQLFRRTAGVAQQDKKGNIGPTRGVAYADDITTGELDCSTTAYSDIGVYDLQNLLNGTLEPGVVDGKINSCQHLNTLTGMTDTDDPTLSVVLCVDGIKKDLGAIGSGEFWGWSEKPIAGPGFEQWGSRNELGDPILLGSYDDCKQNLITYLEASYTIVTYDSDEDVTLTTDQYNNQFTEFAQASPVWLNEYTIKRATVTADGTTLYFLLFSVPPTYTFPDAGEGFIYPLCFIETGEIEDTNCFDSEGTITSLDSGTRAYQLILNQSTRMWEKDPDGTLTPTKFNLPVSIVDVKYNSDANFARIRPSKSGGLLLFGTDTLGESSPNGLIRVYNNDRTLQQRITPAEIGPFKA